MIMDPTPELMKPDRELSTGPEIKLGTAPESEGQHKLLLKLEETRANAQAHAQKVALLLGVHISETEAQPPVDALSQLEALAKEEAIPPSEFLSRSRQVLRTSVQLRDQARAEQQVLWEQQYFHQNNIRFKIDERLRELDQAKGLRGILAALEKRRLEGQKTDIQRQIGQLEAQIQAKQQFVDQISEKEKPVRRKQEETLLAEIGQEIQAIRSEYEQLVQDVFQDGTMTAEIREAYIQQVITPKVDKIVEERQLPQDKREAFYSALRTYIDHREEPEAQSQPYKEELDRLFTYDEGFYDVVSYCELLMNNGDKKIVQKLVAKMAAQDIAPIKDIAESHFNVLGWDWKLGETIEKAVGRRSQGLGSNILENLTSKERDVPSWQELPFQRALKSSTTAMGTFSELIERQDRENYEALLADSLVDHPHHDQSLVNLIEYYPTPDAIRNWTLMASKRYSFEGLTTAINSLYRREDLQEIFERAQHEYPALEKMRPIIDRFAKEGFLVSPVMQDSAFEFAQQVIDSVPNNTRLIELAREVQRSSIKHTIEALHRTGKLSDDEFTALIQTADLLRERSAIPGKHHDEFFFRDHVFQNSASLFGEGDENLKKSDIAAIKRLALLSKAIVDNKDEPDALEYLIKYDLFEKLKDSSLNQENTDLLLSAFKELPQLTENFSLRSEFFKQFVGKDTVSFFKDMVAVYFGKDEQLLEIIKLIGINALAKERALELPTKAGDILSSPSFSLAVEHPTVFLVTDQNADFFRKMVAAYQDSSQIMGQVSTVVENESLSRELALAFPQQASALMGKKMSETRSFVFKHANTMLKDTSDLRFLNNVVGDFGQKADFLIRGYQECLAAGVITTSEKDIVLEFARQFRVISPTTLGGYKEAKQTGHEKVYIAQLQVLAERMTGSGIITEEERKRPYYNDLLRHVYANNSGQWSSFKSNDGCIDRSGDLAEFKIKPRYEIDLLSQSEIRVKAGETLNHFAQEEVQRPILGVAERMNALGHDKEKINVALGENIDKVLEDILQNGGLRGINFGSVTSPEEKMFLILTDSMYGTGSVDPKQVKDLVITYEFAKFEDISDYMAGTRDRVGRANNQDYALLCEVGTFYSDRIKEVNRRLVEAAYNNPQIVALMPEYFKQLSQDSVTVQRQDWINRLQIDRLGASESFVKQVAKVLEKRRGRKYEPDEVKEIIGRYEGLTSGLQEKTSTSKNPQTRAFYGQLRSQRERTIEALRVITGEEVDPQKVHLGEINFQQVLETETRIREGRYDEEQFATYTVQRLIDLFDSERTKIEGELAKFESISGKKREVLYGYMTKNKESANARMVGGVCVAGDNPSGNKNLNMWNMPNYIQLVFQEPDTLQCQGLVLLHHFTEDGKKVLAASVNPSSTYLYSVDESALFNGIMRDLEQFAQDNDFDMITVSQNKTIRTNRTGGLFEKAMDARIAAVGKKFRFSSPQTFSYNPGYQLQDMDRVWERAGI